MRKTSVSGFIPWTVFIKEEKKACSKLSGAEVPSSPNWDIVVVPDTS
jgi:hypothetical protein